MAVTLLVYGQFFKTLGNKEIDIDSDAWYCGLLTGYTPDQDNHDYWNDIVASEVANGNGYTTNGYLLTVTWGYTAGTNVWKFDADDATWSNATLSGTHAAVYDRTPGSDATRPVACYVNFGGTFTSTNGPYTISWHASGIFTVTVA